MCEAVTPTLRPNSRCDNPADWRLALINCPNRGFFFTERLRRNFTGTDGVRSIKPEVSNFADGIAICNLREALESCANALAVWCRTAQMPTKMERCALETIEQLIKQ